MTERSDMQPDAPWGDRELEALAAYEGLVLAPAKIDDAFADRVLERLAAQDAAPDGPAPFNPVDVWPREHRIKWSRALALAAMLAAIIGSGAAVATIGSGRGLGWSARPTLTQLTPALSVAHEKAQSQARPASEVSDPFPARQSPGPLPAELGPELDAYLASYGRRYGPAFRFHGVVSVSRGGETTVAARGRMGVGEDAPEHHHGSRFSLGSLSQQLVAVVAMRMVERGELALDATVAELLPDYRGPGRVATLEQLLSHRSGIPNLTDGLEWSALQGREQGPLELRRVFEHAPLEFEPGTSFEPSSSNYVLIGQILAARAQDTLEAVMSRELFDPVGMQHTTMGEWPLHDVALGQEFDERELLTGATFVHPRALGGAGGIVSDAEDLRRLDRALRSGALLGAATQREMFTPRHERYALGWIVDETQGQPSVAHPGGVDGNNHHILRLADGTTIIVLSNTEVVDARRVAADVAALASGATPDPPVEHLESEISAHQMLRYVGRYAITKASRAAYEEVVDEQQLALLDDVSIYVDGGILWFEVAGYGRKWMHPDGTDSFFFKDRAAGRARFFGLAPHGQAAQLEIREGALRFLLERRELPEDARSKTVRP